MKFIKQMVRKLLYGYRTDSQTYINHLRRSGMSIGERVVVFDPKTTLIDETRPWMIKIGNDVQITRGVTILTHGYDWSVIKGKYGEILGSSGGVSIGNNVFIGMNAIILKGVHVGNNVIIGAGSVVTKSVPDDCIVAGNPARVVCDLEEYRDKRRRKQYYEASELVRQYRFVYKENPGNEELAEFFWLYTGAGDEYQDLPKEYRAKMKCVGNENKSKDILMNHNKQFSSKEELLDSIYD